MRHETNQTQETMWFSKAEGVQAEPHIKRAAKAVAWATTFALLFLSGPNNAIAAKLSDSRKLKSYSMLKGGLTQTPNDEQQKKIAAREAVKRNKPVPAARPLVAAEMQAMMGRGPYRNKYFAGAPMSWHRSIRDVNLCTGNLFKSFTDIQVAPARGAGLALQRTYSSQDERVGPFGIGWTHAYDIRIDESNEIDEDGNDIVTRVDFFGGKHSYTRDADGLYSPPAYMFDEMDSKYDTYLTDGPPPVVEDIQKSMDGSVKHFISGGTKADGTLSSERVCDYMEDQHGNRTNLTYGVTISTVGGGTKKLLTEVRDPSNRTLTFTWNNIGTSNSPAWRITQVQGPLYRVTYQYNTEKNLSSVTLDPDDLNRTTSFGYTSYSGNEGTDTGLLSSISDPLNHTVSYVYSCDTTDTTPGYAGSPSTTNVVWVVSIQESGGVTPQGAPRTRSFFIYPHESSTRALDESGIDAGIYDIMFDSRLRVTQSQLGTTNMDPCSVQYRYSYDTANNVVESARWVLFRYPDYPAAGYSYHNYDPDVPSSESYTVSTYGPHGNVLTQRDGNGYSAFYPPTTYTYYNASKYFQKASMTDPMGRTSTFDYYGAGEPDTTQANIGEVRWVRDAGYAVSGSSSFGKQSTYGYNSFGQKLWEKDLKGIVTKYIYSDSWGNLTQVVRDPDDLANNYTGLNRSTTMSYDVAGKVSSSTNAVGETSTFQYNTLGQPVCAIFPTRGSAQAETVSYNYDLNGRANSISDGRGTTTYTYENGCDRVASVTDPIAGTTSYTYLDSGERETVTYPSGETIQYEYRNNTSFHWDRGRIDRVLTSDDGNQMGRMLASITDGQGRKVQVTPGYDGRLRRVRFNQTFQNGEPVQFAETVYRYKDDINSQLLYPNRSVLTDIETRWKWYGVLDGYQQWQTKVLWRNQHVYNSAGQRTQNAISGTMPVSTRTETYAYNELNRLTNVNYGDGQVQSYSFDTMGNRSSKTSNNSSSETYTYNNLNELTSRSVSGNASPYSNDALGNTLSGGGRTNVWDSQNRLTQCEYDTLINKFTYSADGLRRRMEWTEVTDGSQRRTDYVLDGDKVVAETVRNRDNNNVAWGNPETVSYLMGPSGPMYRKVGVVNTDVRWYVHDGLGSVVGEINVNGQPTTSNEYDVYGAVRKNKPWPIDASGTGSVGYHTRHGFVGNLGHSSDPETGLIYMQARYYDPQLGRFTSSDPAMDGTNWFSYCSNDPVNYTDATGKTKAFGDFFILLRLGNGLISNGAAMIGTGLTIAACVKLRQKTPEAFAEALQMTNVASMMFAIALIGSGASWDFVGSFSGGIIGAVGAGYMGGATKDFAQMLGVAEKGESHPFAYKAVTAAVLQNVMVAGAVGAADYAFAEGR